MIFFLIPKLPNTDIKNIGGGELSNLILIKAISREQSVIVFPLFCNGHDSDYKFSKNVKIVQPLHFFHGRLGYFLEKYFFYNRRVLKFATKLKPQKVIAMRSTVYAAYELKKASDYCMMEIVVRAYEDFRKVKKFDTHSKISFYRKIDRLFFDKKMHKSYRAMDKAIVNSRFMLNALHEELGSYFDYSIIYPNIMLPKVKPKFDRISRIGFVNRGAKKGEEIVIQLAVKNPSIQFLIFGDKLNNVQKDNIFYLGYLSNRSELFSLIDIILMPSLWFEPYGRVASEAIWSGKAPLVSNRGGLPEAAPDDFFLVNDLHVQRSHIYYI